jgi:hypothetical protein
MIYFLILIEVPFSSIFLEKYLVLIKDTPSLVKPRDKRTEAAVNINSENTNSKEFGLKTLSLTTLYLKLNNKKIEPSTNAIKPRIIIERPEFLTSRYFVISL